MALSRFSFFKEIRFSELDIRIRKFGRFSRSNKGNGKEQFESIASPFQDLKVDIKNLQISKLIKPFGFTIFFSSACFCGAAIWQYENMRSHAINLLKKTPYSFRQSELPKSYVWRRKINHWWKSLSQGEKVFVPIAFLNAVVFLAWKVPHFQPFMLRYFCSNPGSKTVCLPMILSTFSHYSLFHLLANMYVLHSFSTGAVASLGKEQFVALYLTGGVMSSLASNVYKVIMKQPGFSLGASGAIMTILGYVCTQYPDTKLGIIFLPFFTFSAGHAIKAIMGLDALGVLMGWKIFDHAAHLGGAVAGIAYATKGNQYIWQKKDPILEGWHEIRGTVK